MLAEIFAVMLISAGVGPFLHRKYKEQASNERIRALQCQRLERENAALSSSVLRLTYECEYERRRANVAVRELEALMKWLKDNEALYFLYRLTGSEAHNVTFDIHIKPRRK